MVLMTERHDFVGITVTADFYQSFSVQISRENALPFVYLWFTNHCSSIAEAMIPSNNDSRLKQSSHSIQLKFQSIIHQLNFDSFYHPSPVVY